MVDGNASAPQLRRVINRLNLEMDVRKSSIDEQLAGSGGQLALPDQTTGGPPVGTEVDNEGVKYRFKGGDPNKQENWEPVQ